MMTSMHAKRRSAFTLVEEMVVISILAVTVIGTSAYQYHATIDAQKSDLNTTAVRTALMLCEGWAGTGGDPNYNPADTFGSDLDISVCAGPAFPSGFTKLESYKITIDNISYFATLSWKDSGTLGLKTINILMKWDQHGRAEGELANADKSYQLTTYTRKW